jgi:deferrochelatase/peroxidase EfeB
VRERACDEEVLQSGGNYDRLLDFSKPVTGSLFFAPSSTFLDKIS